MEKTTSEQQAQIERAKRLRAQVERLKSGGAAAETDQPKSIREQVEERSQKPPRK
jgi:hypothetical protein